MLRTDEVANGCGSHFVARNAQAQNNPVRDGVGVSCRALFVVCCVS